MSRLCTASMLGYLIGGNARTFHGLEKGRIRRGLGLGMALSRLSARIQERGTHRVSCTGTDNHVVSWLDLVSICSPFRIDYLPSLARHLIDSVWTRYGVFPMTTPSCLTDIRDHITYDGSHVNFGHGSLGRDTSRHLESTAGTPPDM